MRRERTRSYSSRERRDSRKARNKPRETAEAGSTTTILKSLLEALAPSKTESGGVGRLNRTILEREMRRREFLEAARTLQDGDT